MTHPNIDAPLAPEITPAQLSDSELAGVKSAILAKLTLAVGKDPSGATDRDWFVAAALAVRDRIIHRWLAADRAHHGKGRKRVYYLSLEFLIGRLFSDVLGNLGLTEIYLCALGDLGVDLNRMRTAEPDAALGNGGLGRLAACFMESMATLGYPAFGYGIRYDHGLFRQVIRDGWQQEYPEEWLSFGNPWEFERPAVIYDVQFGGRVERTPDRTAASRSVWHPDETIEAVAYRHADRGVARPACQFLAPVVGARGRPAAARRVQPRRSCRGVVGSDRAPKRSPKSFTRATTRRRGGSCACARSISWSPPRCRICCSDICARTATSIFCRTAPPSSSTTRIRASPCPN